MGTHLLKPQSEAERPPQSSPEDATAAFRGVGAVWKARLLRAVGLVQRHPRILALFGFVSGIASFALVDRQDGFARVIPLLMLAVWFLLLLQNVLARGFARRFGQALPDWVPRYATQMIHQESLFFVLPFFFVTTAWNSGQAVFSVVLLGAALVALVDPLYYRWLAPRQPIYLAYHALTLFAVLLTALPIIFHLTTPESYKLALGAAVLLSLPSLLQTVPLGGWRRWAALAGLSFALGLAGWQARSWIPPATLWLTKVALTEELGDGRTPGRSLATIDAARLRANGLFAYTAIRAPRGLDERIYHVWQHDGTEVDRIALDIKGGREEGYRAWTHKRNFPDAAAGRWQVRVLTEAGQMIGTLRFRVVE